MTNRKAIVLLSQMYLPCFDDEEKQAITMAIEALEKQIPKVAKKVDVQPYFRKHYSNDLACPVCHNRVSVKMNYCPNCGQRLE